MSRDYVAEARDHLTQALGWLDQIAAATDGNDQRNSEALFHHNLSKAQWAGNMAGAALRNKREREAAK